MDMATLTVALCAVVLTALAVRDRVTNARVTEAAVWSDVKDWKSYSAVGHRVGAPTAPVTLVEFVDYQCPACAVFAQTLKQVRAAHPDDLTIVYRHWPLPIHPFAPTLARAAECAADQGAFEAYHDAVFQLRDSVTRLTIGQLGARVGIRDTTGFVKCAANTAPVTAVERDIADAKRLGGRGTPTILLNDKRLAMVPDSTRLEELISQVKRRR